MTHLFLVALLWSPPLEMHAEGGRSSGLAFLGKPPRRVNACAEAEFRKYLDGLEDYHKRTGIIHRGQSLEWWKPSAKCNQKAKR